MDIITNDTPVEDAIRILSQYGFAVTEDRLPKLLRAFGGKMEVGIIDGVQTVRRGVW